MRTGGDEVSPRDEQNPNNNRTKCECHSVRCYNMYHGRARNRKQLNSQKVTQSQRGDARARIERRYIWQGTGDNHYTTPNHLSCGSSDRLLNRVELVSLTAAIFALQFFTYLEVPEFAAYGKAFFHQGTS